MVAMTRVGHGAGLRTVPPRRPLRLFSYAAKGELAASFAELNVPPHRCCWPRNWPTETFCEMPRALRRDGRLRHARHLK